MRSCIALSVAVWGAWIAIWAQAFLPSEQLHHRSASALRYSNRQQQRRHGSSSITSSGRHYSLNNNNNGTAATATATATAESENMSTLIEADTAAQQHFLDSIIAMQYRDPDSIRLLADDHVLLNTDTINDANTTPLIRCINSLVFEIHDLSNNSEQASAYVLAVLAAEDRVNVTLLELAFTQHLAIETDERRALLTLAPYHRVESLSGFAPGTVPPLGLAAGPIVTLVDQALTIATDKTATDSLLLQGGGGRIDHSCLVALSTLLQLPGVHVADFRTTMTTKDYSTPKTRGGLTAPPQQQPLPKPYFAAAPPDTTIAEIGVRQDPRSETPLSPVAVAVVGRITGVRRMARRLVFCDFGPVSGNHYGPNDHPWRSPVSGNDMSVQLIAGKTFCQTVGDAAAEAALRQFKVGQIVLVQGTTNVGNRESLGHWIDKQSLDIIVHNYSILEEVGDGPALLIGTPANNVQLPSGTDRSVVSDFAAQVLAKKRANRAPANLGISYLRINELYGVPDEERGTHVTMVDSLETVNGFANDLSQLYATLITQHATAADDGSSTDSANDNFQAALVGMDCEWRPSFYAASYEPQPVLLLQICIHPLKRIYLFDMQALLRPLLSPSEEMNGLEAAVSDALGEVFSSERLIKTGFQVMQDFRRMAASYPHIPSFQVVNAVLEAASLGKNVMHVLKQRNARSATSSLSRFTERFLGRTLNKEEQISDWSVRPLSEEQIEYAALDAAVTPAIVEKLMESVDAKFFSKPQIGRWKDDVSFSKFITSWRFLFLETDDTKSIRKLRAKRIIGDPFVVTQFWISGGNPPSLPSLPHGGDGPYTDTDGILRIPSLLLSIQQNGFDSTLAPLLGEHVGKSKDRCLAGLLSGNKWLPEGAKLEYGQRSGYVEFEDGAALFVNLPSKPGWGKRRGYPNEWLEDGHILTWFIRGNEWNGGASSLAHKLLGKEEDGKSSVIVLFVRSGKGSFICCGRCRVVSLDGKVEEKGDASEEWALVKLHLMLSSWSDLQRYCEFRALVNPSRACEDLGSNGSDNSFEDEPTNGASIDY
jgi:prolyl-tRNA editing enzyme YbaK/EbsC (Cys-tRNA(Pro) deacylase)